MDNKIIWFENCNYINKELVGGKNASLGALARLTGFPSIGIKRYWVERRKPTIPRILLGMLKKGVKISSIVS